MKDRKPRRPIWEIDRENLDRLSTRLQFEMKERMYLAAITESMSPENEKIAFRDAIAGLQQVEGYLSPPEKSDEKPPPGDTHE